MNTIIKQVKTISLLLLGLGLSVGVHAQQTLTLKQALNYAVQNNINAKKARLDIDRGRYRTDEIRGQALPQINGNAGLTYNPIIGQLVVGDQSFQLGRAWNANAGVQLDQQIFNQTVFTGLRAAKASESYYNLNAQLTDEQVIEQVANNYYQVLLNRERIKVIDTNIKIVQASKDIISNKFENGLARKIDVDRLTVRLTNLQNDRTQTQNSIIQLENQLKFSMGMPVETTIVLPPAELNSTPVLPALADSVDFTGRTEIQLLETQIDLYELQRKAYLAEYYPSLALTGNFSYTGMSDKFDLFKSNSSAFWYDASAIGLTLRVPIFNGFATRARVRQARVDIMKANEDMRNTKNSLNLAYENAKIQLRNSISTITSQRENVELAQDIYLSTQNNYDNGLATLTDLLDTQTSLAEAQNSYNQALVSFKIAEIQLIKSNGNIKSLL